MILDAAEMKMVRAIVQTAVVEAAAGRPFYGVFRGVLVRTRCMRGTADGPAEFDAEIVLGPEVSFRFTGVGTLSPRGAVMDAVPVQQHRLVVRCHLSRIN